jgi:hypothetical protein
MLSADTITDDQIDVLEDYGSGVWSVGITLPNGTYVGVGVSNVDDIPAAKTQVRARCAEIFNARDGR